MMILTPHAIERYRERVEDIHPREVMARILTPETLDAIEFGARAIKRGDGAKLVIENGVIVTVLGPDQRTKKSRNGHKFRRKQRKGIGE